ncbi:neurogranin-like [Mya arenaria]|uniref:neurogranin-like n=1 Tax=Mya arenaria TaxID=6604 RepID=UPI0022E3BBF7|nr:neurogranin-like [Mya arenaria]
MMAKASSSQLVGVANEGLEPQDEVVDIDLEDPDVQQAAVKIQAGFRKHVAHKTSQQDKLNSAPADADGLGMGPSSKGGGANDNNAQGTSGQAQEEEEVDIDLNDPDVADAAAKIQAGFKKHMMKKKK